MECKVCGDINALSTLLGFNRDIVECKDVIDWVAVKLSRRFNRDIVECKELQVAFFQAGIWDLIETLWNVKGTQALPAALESRFNRDIVECKDITPPLHTVP